MLTHRTRKFLLIAAMAIFALVASAALMRSQTGGPGAARPIPQQPVPK